MPQRKRWHGSEAFTYAISGLILGFGIGIPLSRFLYTQMITRHFGVVWHLPIGLLGIVIVFVFVCAVIAAYAPAKRIQSMAITATINDL